MIDTHLHLWNLAAPPGWLTPELRPIHRTFAPEQAREALSQNGYRAAVLVQVDDTLEDTEQMVQIARAHPWVLGVVGWVDLTRPETVAAQLEHWGTTSEGTGPIAGVRHLIHEDRRSDFLDLAQVRESFRLLAARNIPVDIPDAFPRHLRQTIDLADAIPELTIVLDHLGKPPASVKHRAEWQEQIIDLAARPNVVAKISGLHHGGRALTADVARAVTDLALEYFTPYRLMVGSDWPMPLLADGLEVLTRYRDNMLSRVDETHRALITHAVAHRVYHLEDPDVDRNQPVAVRLDP